MYSLVIDLFIFNKHKPKELRIRETNKKEYNNQNNKIEN